MKPSVKVGLIGGIVVLTSLLIQSLFLPQGAINILLTFLPFVVMLAGIYFAIKQQRTLQDGAIEFIPALRVGFTVVLFCYAFYVLGLYIGIHTVDLKKQVIDMHKNGKSITEIEQHIKGMSSEANLIWGSMQFGMLPLIMGSLGSLSAALLLSKKKTI